MVVQRRWWAGAAVAGAGMLIGATAVFACSSLSTLNLSQASGVPGSNINITGSSFGSVSHGSSPVTLHWNAVDGTVLATNIVPDASGAIGPVAVTIPAGTSSSTITPGFYTIVATQNGSDGKAEFGTPARASFQVTGAAGGTAAQPAVGPTASSLNASTSGLGAGVIALLAALGVAGLLLFGLGAATFVGSYRRTASVSRVRKP